jgi:hypothetical protein
MSLEASIKLKRLQDSTGDVRHGKTARRHSGDSPVVDRRSLPARLCESHEFKRKLVFINADIGGIVKYDSQMNLVAILYLT